MFLWSIAILLLAAGFCRAQEVPYDWQAWGAVTDTLRSVKNGQRVGLSSSFIVTGSEKVVVNGVELAPIDYEINYQRGLIRIDAVIGEDTPVIVSYTRLPFLLKSVYSLRPIEFAEGEGAHVAVPRPEPQFDKDSQSYFNPTGNLAFGGMKSISFTVGSNQSASLDQALRATVEGDLTSSIRVKALLSDDNLPIQPEGNTQELEYLDKVYVEITGPRAGATLGDFAYANDYSDFNLFRRELKGALGRVNLTEKSRVEVAGGSSKGVFRAVKFRGINQLQGPYDLLAQGGFSNEVIIAGSEKVFFDGERLLRGQNRDYVIDYDRGTITFTTRRSVTADTEIAVDFEATQEKYDRTSIFANAMTQNLPVGFRLSAAAATEKDDSNRPKSVTLSDDEREIIAEAGDNPANAIAGGATFVGEGNGDYVVVPADSIAGTPEYFEFSDSSGTYNVVFVDIGFLQGDYVLEGVNVEGRTIYRFVGVGKGRYIVGKALPLPQSHSIYTGRLTRAGGRFLDVDLQYNISDFDANTLSSSDDWNNVGEAGEARIRLKEIPLLVGKLDLTGTMSTIEDTYRSLEKSRPTYFYRDWNLENELLVGREILQEGTTTFKRNDTVKLDYSMGKIKRDNFDGTKQEVRASVVGASDRKLTGRAFATETDGERDRRTREHGNITVSYGLWKFVPAFEYTTEEYLLTSDVTADSGIAFDRYIARLGSRNTGRLSYSIFADQRDTEEFEDTNRVWVETRTDQAIGGSLSSRRHKSLQGEVQLTHRIRDDKLFNTKSTSDLARLNGLVRLDPLGLRSTAEYEVSQNRQRAQQKSVVFVGEGQGDYNELGEPVGKGRGAFTVVFLPTPLTVPTSTLDFTWNLSWKMKRADRGRGPFAWVLSNVTLNQSLRVREETTARDAYKVYLLFPSALQRDESTLAGIVSFRQEWSLLESYPNWSLALKYQRDDEEENRFNNVNEERLFEQQLVRLDRSLTTSLSANIELRREVKQRGGRGLTTGIGSTYDVLGLAVAGGWGLRFSAGSTLDGEIEYSEQEDSESGAREVAITFRPRFVWRLTKSLNLFGRYEATRFTLTEDTGVKPFYFSNPGTTHRWALTPNLRLSKVISLLGTYQGRSEETFSGSRIVDHELTVETRAYF